MRIDCLCICGRALLDACACAYTCVWVSILVCAQKHLYVLLCVIMRVWRWVDACLERARRNRAQTQIRCVFAPWEGEARGRSNHDKMIRGGDVTYMKLRRGPGRGGNDEW